jgi:ATPase subunit of ABC transporter with duplicated ATPase domains
VAKAYGEKELFSDLNFVLPPNGIVGVIGPNGAGKTTLFRLIMGLEQADAGSFSVGETVKLSYVDQQHKDIDPAKTVYQVVSQGNETLRMGGKDIIMYVRIFPVLISVVLIRRKNAQCSLEVNAIGCIWPLP